MALRIEKYKKADLKIINHSSNIRRESVLNMVP